MPVVHRFGKREGDSRTDADQRRLFDAELGSDLVGSEKADTADVSGQAIGVFRDQLNGVGTVGLVNTHRPRCADPVTVQK